MNKKWEKDQRKKTADLRGRKKTDGWEKRAEKK